jgi:hypothetical protein
MKKDKNYAEGMLKGRMAEIMVEEMLKKSGNTVYRFGYEAILQNLTQIQKSFDRHTDASERIHCIPDFIVLNDKESPIFLEVKFRADGQLHSYDKERLRKIKEFWNAKILFINCLTKPYFQLTNPPYFDKEGNIKLQSLLEEKGWKIDEKIYHEYENLVDKYLRPILFPPK